MIKFIKKKHVHEDKPDAKFVIYYSVSDIVLGFLLIGLVSFFVVNYVQRPENLGYTPGNCVRTFFNR